MDVIPIAKLNFSSYRNKKGQVKYQLVADREILEKILNSDPIIIQHLKSKLDE